MARLSPCRLIVGCLCGLFCVPAAAQETVLPESRWDVLPDWVYEAYVDHGGRLWTRGRRNIQDPRLDEGLELIEAAYAAKSPQLAGVRFALFDEQQRAWFYDSAQRRLIGYDGRQWIVRKLADGDQIIRNEHYGRCPTWNQFSDPRCNHSSAGVCWFIEVRGVHRFDGRDWTFRQVIAEGDKAPHAGVRLAVSPDGKSALAYLDDRGPAHLYREDGTWETFELPRTAADRSIRQLLLTNDHVVWYLTASGRLRSQNVDPKAPAPADPLAELIANLGASKFAAREDAEASLKSLLPDVMERLKAELADARDAEVRHRLQRLLAVPTPARNGSSQLSAFAGTMIVDPVGLYHDRRGRIFLAARKVIASAGPPTAGLVVVEPDGTSRVIRSDAPIDGLASPDSARSTPPLLLADGRSASVPGSNSGEPAHLLDLASGSVRERLPDARYGTLCAIDPAGRVYARGNGHSVMVFDSRKPDDRIALRPEQTPEQANFVGVAGDGGIWINDRRDVLQRFNGRTWSPMSEPAQRPEGVSVGFFGQSNVQWLKGNGGVGIAIGRDCRLYDADRLLATDRDLKKLILENRTAIVAGFQYARGPDFDRFESLQLVVDADGDIWLHQERVLWVLGKTEWHAVNGMLPRPSLVQEFFTVAAVGGRVYASDGNRNLLYPDSFLLDYVAGRIEARPAPRTTDIRDPQRASHDLWGGLWVSGNTVFPDDKRHQFGQWTFRIDHGGTVQTFQSAGTPLLVDSWNQTWLRRFANQPRHLVGVWRDGRPVQTIAAPGTDEIYGASPTRRARSTSAPPPACNSGARAMPNIPAITCIEPSRWKASPASSRTFITAGSDTSSP
ncbi:MAG: hypothetical protein QM775_33010 [Pirellulales bacterium]